MESESPEEVLMENFNIEKAFYLLNNGYILHVNADNGGGEIWLDGKYFRLSYFGITATEATFENLTNIFSLVFHCSDYIAFSSREEIQLNYFAKDERSLWIFTDGKYNGFDPYII